MEIGKDGALFTFAPWTKTVFNDIIDDVESIRYSFKSGLPADDYEVYCRGPEKFKKLVDHVHRICSPLRMNCETASGVVLEYLGKWAVSPVDEIEKGEPSQRFWETYVLGSQRPPEDVPRKLQCLHCDQQHFTGGVFDKASVLIDGQFPSMVSFA